MGVFADRLKIAMQQAGMSSAQLSKTTGIGRSSISQWLSSKYVAKHDKVATLAAALEVDGEWLLGTTDVQNVTESLPAEPVIEATPPVAPELVSIWEQLDEPRRAKLLKKANKLLEKAVEPTPKHKSKKKKKGKKRKA
ncbi:helix-turn-helix domain-containing protein [Lactiplantibacillus garii]|uniref:Helix-turn-helix domain-containing protein n=1 Tax=Lactiplantibacillus garii TaxID=2306423 RepID=A0A3R8J732_9LACO|nr:helix-turn-helix domain-containing protein [Lactiplantibacillus garii]RRK10529.1 helix-turn-helix domain-containing protein [Lactiplantibacillus garii]